MKRILLVALLFSAFNLSAQQTKPFLLLYDDISLKPFADTISVQPWQKLAIVNTNGNITKVFDGNGKMEQALWFVKKNLHY